MASKESTKPTPLGDHRKKSNELISYWAVHFLKTIEEKLGADLIENRDVNDPKEYGLRSFESKGDI